MAIKKRPISPRQKMINLLYVVLMAMLALNVSTEVLEGFSVVEDSLKRTISGSTKQNEALYDVFASQLKSNPEKVKAWFDKAEGVKRASDSLFNFVEKLKVAIVREADGSDADVHDIVNKENLEAASHVMLAPIEGKGRKLYEGINAYRNYILKMVNDRDTQRQAFDGQELARIHVREHARVGRSDPFVEVTERHTLCRGRSVAHTSGQHRHERY